MNAMSTHVHHRFADGLGLINTVLCILHCTALPVLVLLGAGFLEHPWVDALFVLIAGLAVWWATRGGTSRPVALLMWSALVLFALAMALEHRMHVLHEVGLVASGLLLVGHLLNLRHKHMRGRSRCSG